MPAGSAGGGVARGHRVLRVHGGRLVVAERRLDLEAELDAAAAEGFELVNSFAVDDNVYLVLRRAGRTRVGSRGAVRQNSVNAWMETTRFRPVSLAR